MLTPPVGPRPWYHLSVARREKLLHIILVSLVLFLVIGFIRFHIDGIQVCEGFVGFPRRFFCFFFSSTDGDAVREDQTAAAPTRIASGARSHLGSSS